MSRTLITLSLVLSASLAAKAQHVYSIRADSVRIYNVCDTAELILENKTQGVQGYLYNRGAGRTEFRKLKMVAIGNSKLAIAGQDTIDLATLTHIGGIDTVYRSGDSLRFVKRGIVSSFYAPATQETLQTVTERSNVSSRDGDNLILKRATTGAGNLVLRFRNSDNSDRGYIGYSGSNHNSFVIHTYDGSMTAVSGKLQVNSPVDNEQTNGLIVGGNTRTIGFFKQTYYHPNPENNSGNQLWNSVGGAQLRADAEFRYSANGITKYDNNYSPGVTLVRDSASLGERVPNSSGWYLKIAYDSASALPTPGLGGFRADVPSRRNSVYVSRIRAKLPVGYTLQVGLDPFGTSNSHYFLTDNKGTGKWEDYIHVHHAGNQGTFLPLGYYYLNGARGKVTWYVAYFDIKETTAAAWTDYVRQNYATARPLELFLNNDSTRLEQGTNYSMRIVTPGGQVQIGAQNNSYLHFTTDRENFYFSRPVLAVDKLAIYNSGQSPASTTYLAQTEGRINNSPILTQANATGSFIQNQVASAQTGGLWTTNFIKTNNSFSSSIGAGKAGLILNNAADALRFGIGLSNAESGAGTGSDFSIWRYSDAGASGSATVSMTITRATGAVRFPGSVTMGNDSRIAADSTGMATYSYLGFHDRTGSRYGYVGKGSLLNNDVHIKSDLGRVVLFPKNSTTSFAVDDTTVRYNGGEFHMVNASKNIIHFVNVAATVAKPTLVTRSPGTKIVLYPNVGATTVDYAMGTEEGAIWSSVKDNSASFKWYAATTNIATLAGSGNFTVTGSSTATAFYQSSLRSLKKDIQPFQSSALGILGKAQVRTFIFKADSTGHRNIGFIADEVPAEMATPGRNGVDQASTVGLLVKAVQELEAKNNKLENANASLQQQNQALEKRLQAIEAFIKKQSQ
ncbi:tail fiber domain-containing protein [Chitinophaga caseinilytica]|uniref:Tail fiber domain-containing protein n=1 Tax=Chitinophaga caseinilytica TaxID=2267521 RepID=A0ABZ2Z622_9BACT